MNDAEQVNRPGLDQLGPAVAGHLAGLHGESERVLGVAAEVRQAGEAVQRFGLTDLVALGSCDHAACNACLRAPSGLSSCSSAARCNSSFTAGDAVGSAAARAFESTVDDRHSGCPT